MKKIISLVLALTLCAVAVLALASCGEKDTYSVGVLQLAPHPALDAATEGFKQALIDELGEDKVTFDVQNAAGEPNTCTTIANSFVSKNYDLIMANATAALQAAANATLTIPILGTSITDYGTAMNIEFTGTVGGNISGTSDLAPLDQQAAMVKEMFPEATTVGIIYCSAEPNSKYQADTIKPLLEDLGFTVNVHTFSDTNDVNVVIPAAAAANDVLYVPTDNTAATCAEAIYGAMGNNKKPIIAGESGICKGCGVATLSISYYDLGYATGLMAAKILRGEANVSEMPIEYATKFDKLYNADICTDLGITPPEGYEPIS